MCCSKDDKHCEQLPCCSWLHVVFNNKTTTNFTALLHGKLARVYLFVAVSSFRVVIRQYTSL